MQLTQKETSLLKDLKDQERLCVDKYNKYASQAHDPQLAGLLRQIAGVEQNHWDTLNAIEMGNPPAPPSGSSGSSSTPTYTETYGIADTTEKKDDCYLCSDLLSTEKHAASMYNTSVFEFGQNNLRQILGHIQTEEQGHGEQLYRYMKTNHMYS